MTVVGTSVAVDSVISSVALDAVTSSSGGESFVLSAVRNAFSVFHLEGKVANAGSLPVVGVDVPMSVHGTLFAVDSVVSGETEFTVTASSGSFSGVLSAVIRLVVS